MKNFLLPLILIFLFACEEDDTNPIAVINNDPIDDPATNCRLIEEYFISDLDSSEVTFEKYYYESDRLVKIIRPNIQRIDSAIFIYGANEKIAYVLDTYNNNLDTTEKHFYNQDDRLIEVQFFTGGRFSRNQQIVYRNDTLSKFIFTSNNGFLVDEYDIIIEKDLIKELILISKNGIPVNQDEQRQVMTFDTELNPYYLQTDFSFNHHDYFNISNLTSYNIFHKGVLKQSQELNYNYTYNEFGYPIEKTMNIGGNQQKSYLRYDCN